MEVNPVLDADVGCWSNFQVGLIKFENYRGGPRYNNIKFPLFLFWIDTMKKIVNHRGVVQEIQAQR